jgi:hypothetical protein
MCCSGILFLFNPVSAGLPPVAASEALNISPEVLDINAFFAGSEVTITGSILSSEDIIIEIAGKNSENSFDLKGRIGPFWMTKGNVHLENIPELYLLLLPDGKNWENRAQSLGLGPKYLQDRVSVSGTVEIPPDIFTMFTDLKNNEGLYKVVPKAINYSPGTDGTKLFSAVYRLPALIGTGTYDVIATRISKNGNAMNQIESHFLVRKIGFVKLIDDLASNDRVVYGVTAVVIALAAGLSMGVFFRRSGGAH